jgi:hypothetical protein
MNAGSELRYRDDQARDDRGRFTDEGGGSSGSDGDPRGNSVDSNGKIGYTKRKEAAEKMSSFEKKHVSSYILTNFPNYKADGKRHVKEIGDYRYTFKVMEPGGYKFLEKEPIDRSDDNE